MTAHDPRLAALLGTDPARASGLAGLLASLLPPPPQPEPAEPALDLAALLAEARAAGMAEGHTAGEAQGRAAADAVLAPRLAALDAAAAACRAATSIDEALLSPLLTGLVQRLCETVLMAELAAPHRLRPLVESALAEVAEAAIPTLSAHPDTLALIAADLPPGLATAADPGLPPGHVVVAGPDYRIDAGLADRLARLLKALP